MFCSSRLERVLHGSDLRLRSQDGQSRKEETLNSWPTSSLLVAWSTGVHMGSPCLEGEKSALSSPVTLMAVEVQRWDPH